MENHARCIIAACRQLGLDWETIDDEGNFLRVKLGPRWEYFQLGKNPFNTEVIHGVCRDKIHSHQLLHRAARMPMTRPFLDPNVEERYLKYVEFDSLTAILDEIESEFRYPVVLKKNKGYLGIHVFLSGDRTECESALTAIFNKESRQYDYLAVAQEFIPTESEYRLVCGFHRPLMVYRRGEGAEFNARYWETGAGPAHLETDKSLVAELFEFVRPVFDEIDLGLVGFDIIRSKSGELFLIELNSSPRFDHVIDANGSECVIELYCDLLTEALARRGEKP